MAALPSLLTIIKMAASITKSLRDIRPRRESRDIRVQDTVSIILRTLYFAPDGILSLLKEVSRGARPTDERIRQALLDFNDRQWKIEGAVEGLEFGALKKELGINLNSIMALTTLRDGKIDLRSAVQNEVNSYGQQGESPDRANVRKLIKAIEELNGAIEQVEEAINQRASVGPPVRAARASKKRPSRK